VCARAGSLQVAHASQEPLCREAQSGGRGGEQQTVLVAVATATRLDELALHVGEGDGDAAAEHDVEVLERDGRHVGPVQRREGGSP